MKVAFWSASTVVVDDVLLPALLCKRSGAPVVVQAELMMYEYLAESPNTGSHRRRRMLCFPSEARIGVNNVQTKNAIDDAAVEQRV